MKFGKIWSTLATSDELELKLMQSQNFKLILIIKILIKQPYLILLN